MPSSLGSCPVWGGGGRCMPMGFEERLVSFWPLGVDSSQSGPLGYPDLLQGDLEGLWISSLPHSGFTWINMGTLLCVMLSYCGVSGSPGGWTLRLSAIIIIIKPSELNRWCWDLSRCLGREEAQGWGWSWRMMWQYHSYVSSPLLFTRDAWG